MAQPFRKRRHLCAEHDEVGRIGDREDKTRGAGDESAEEEIRQRLHLRGPGRFVDRRGHTPSAGALVRRGEITQMAELKRISLESWALPQRLSVAPQASYRVGFLRICSRIVAWRDSLASPGGMSHSPVFA